MRRLRSVWAFAAAVLAVTTWGRVELRWTEAPALPGIGVLLPFAGVSNGRVLLAGGSNFPNRPPAEGGKRHLCDEIYALDPSAADPAWTLVGRLASPAGQGGSATVPAGVVCVGGLDAGGQPTGKSFLLSWQDGRTVIRPLPDLPAAAKEPAVAAHGSVAYVASGDRVWRLDTADGSSGWQELDRLPEAIAGAKAAVQNVPFQRTALFVFGDRVGYALTVAPVAERGWRRVELPLKVPAAAPLAVGDQHILFFGGFPFTNAVSCYHTVTDRMFDYATATGLPKLGQAVLRLPDGRILSATGEVAAGVRTPECFVGTFARTKSWHWVNYAIVVLYFAAMAFMGFWFMRRNRNADDYFKGGGRLPWWVVSLSIYATMFSSITFLSIPALTYVSDCRYFGICFGIIVLAPVVVKWYLPFFRRLNLTSAYEYLEVRFNLACRLFASAAFILFMIARTAIVTYLPAIALSAVIGIDVNVSIVVVTAITILYCTLGGVEAVIWSDFVQSVILILGTVAIYVFLVCGTDGGWSGFVSMGSAAGKFRVFDFALDWTKPVFWVTFVGGVVANLASYTSDQCVVQRYMTTPDEKGAAKSILFNGVLSFLNCIVFFTIGVAIWTFYRSNPQLLDVTMAKNDAVFPLFIGNDLPAGVSGVILAAVAAATMSTLSANLNAAASAFTTDFYKRLVLRNRTVEQSEQSEQSNNRLLRCGKICTVVTGLLGGGFALVLANMEVYSIYDQFQRFLGVLTGGLGCLFFMGIFLKRVNAVGATAGLVANYAVCFALDQTAFAGKPHLLLYGALGMTACLVVAPIASALTRRPDDGKPLEKQK